MAPTSRLIITILKGVTALVLLTALLIGVPEVAYQAGRDAPDYQPREVYDVVRLTDGKGDLLLTLYTDGTGSWRAE